MSIPQTPRRTERKGVALAATCRTANGMRYQGHISDISGAGCCLVADTILVKVDARIVIRPEGIEGLGGIVRWIRGNRVGVEFEIPLYQPVVDHLTARFAQEGPLAVSYS